MADSERKRLVWAIKKDLLMLSADELYQVAKTVVPVPGLDWSRLKLEDEEGVSSTLEASCPVNLYSSLSIQVWHCY